MQCPSEDSRSGRGSARCGEAETGSRSEGQMFLCVYYLRRLIAMHWHAMFVRCTTATVIPRRCRLAAC